MPVVPITLAIVFTACPDPEDLKDKGSKAAIEFCECYKENTKETCLEYLKDRYEYAQYMSEGFIDSFNRTSVCGIELVKEHINSASLGIEYKPGIYPPALQE